MYFTRVLAVLILVAPTLLLAFHHHRLVTIDAEHEHERLRVTRDDTRPITHETHHEGPLNHQFVSQNHHSDNHEFKKEKFFDYNQKGVNSYEDDIDHVTPMKHHLAPIYGENSAHSDGNHGFNEHHSGGVESNPHHNEFHKYGHGFHQNAGSHGSVEFGVKGSGQNNIAKRHMEHVKSTVVGIKSHVHGAKDHLMDKFEHVGKEKSFGFQKHISIDVSMGVNKEEDIDQRHLH